MYKPFSEIPIDHYSIAQSELNIDNKTRSNLFTWNGQFSPQFIESLLKTFSNNSDIVFDPFLGSGTTLYESARMGLPAFGMELNPSAYYMSKTYELINLDKEKRISVIDEIDQLIHSIFSDDSVLPVLTDYVTSNQGSVTANIISVLVILLDIYNHDVSNEYLLKKWTWLKEIIICLPYSHAPINAFMGDSRSVPMANSSASLLITSPPYINVFNYHQKYRRSVEALGFDVLSIAKNEFGSNRKNRGNRLLTVIQYCIDMALSICESCRICSDNSRMIYVVGRESCVLGYSFCNSQLIYEIFSEIFDLPLILRQERVFKNRYGQNIFEDILHFSNNEHIANADRDTIISKAQSIASRMLAEKVSLYPESKNTRFLVDAIDRANQIKPSEG